LHITILVIRDFRCQTYHKHVTSFLRIHRSSTFSYVCVRSRETARLICLSHDQSQAIGTMRVNILHERGVTCPTRPLSTYLGCTIDKRGSGFAASSHALRVPTGQLVVGLAFAHHYILLFSLGNEVNDYSPDARKGLFGLIKASNATSISSTPTDLCYLFSDLESSRFIHRILKFISFIHAMRGSLARAGPLACPWITDGSRTLTTRENDFPSSLM
jgi:hypothetical protein